ncbi:hypothetical protein COCOR_01418 [Corallococcus coralloides DSM 2259]|uniref:Uncharacterized protein n=1 Tax=Corallococcus coralloides (strain ATCC 25202 / DSM 2259 / NBRC 100086 / M2) TaxID=1144275 RepID=H8MV69_CORCM|nr:hypothetical protein [Corallococcus coralloides]AFE04046.1 hypothetical protein COCOR_01418 [Corallococcus coralloides DSM 2259]
MAGPPKEIRTKFAGIGLDTEKWGDFEKKLARLQEPTLQEISKYLQEIFESCEDRPAVDRTFWLVERLTHRSRRSLTRLTTLETLALRLSAVSEHLLAGTSDSVMQKAYQGLRSDFDKLHQGYKGMKGDFLGRLKAKEKSSKPVSFEKRVDQKVGRVAEQARKPNRYTKLEDVDMHGVRVLPGKQASWMEALVQLTVLRKRMQGAELKRVAHHTTAEKWSHILTEVILGDTPTGVFIHNSKKSNGEGATRVISFVDESGDILRPDIQSTEDLDALRIIDLSYPELYELLEEVEYRFCDDSATLAKVMCALVGIGPEDSKPRSFFPEVLRYGPKIKAFGQKRKVVEGTARVTAEVVLVSFLSVLFLTEPRHSLPIWVSNADALQCIAQARLTFYDMLQPSLTFAADVRTVLRVDLRSDTDDISIGALLASANTAKYTLSPDEEHTRKLKELVMPACELYFKHGNVRGLKVVTDSMSKQLFEADEPSDEEEDDMFDRSATKKREVPDSVWFVEYLDGLGMEALEKAPQKDPDKMALTHQLDTTQKRKLTFVAPVAKMLVLREILDA